MEGVETTAVNMEKRREIGIRPGDTVRVWQKIQERGKTRLQAFEGLVLARKHGNEPGATFTVRKVASGVGVEKIFPLYSPMIDKIEIVRRSKVRRAKLYFIREKVAREIRRQMRNMRMMDLSTGSDIEEQEKEAKQAAEAEAEKEEEVKNEAVASPETPEEASEGTESPEGAPESEETPTEDDKTPEEEEEKTA